jgi:hybrid cluster-associated redox disulfide protein
MSDVKEYITKDMIIMDVIREYPDAITALMDCGMGCVGCPASQGETVEEASMVHGLNPDEVIDYVNHVLEEKLAE